MRLLNIHTLQFLECYGEPPPYVITSHRWKHDELAYQDLAESIISSHVKEKAGYLKLVNFCIITRKLNETCPEFKVDHLWIDTCCIDKTNSVELTEALNSMFRWYAQAKVCLAYLFDVVSLDQHPSVVLRSFKGSVWHKRGWCLQELLAPKMVLFYNLDWKCLGWKPTRWGTSWMTARVCGIGQLNAVLAEITGIPEKVLWDYDNTNELISVRDKLAWMNSRSTSRIEDKVYCQLGILGVFMPLIYGEGDHALIRLEDALEQKRRHCRATGSRQVLELLSNPRHQIPLRRTSPRLEPKVKCHITFDDESAWIPNLQLNISMNESETVRSLRDIANFRYADMNDQFLWSEGIRRWELLLLPSKEAQQGQIIDEISPLKDLKSSRESESRWLWFKAVMKEDD